MQHKEAGKATSNNNNVTTKKLPEKSQEEIKM